jgi:hypothetical protein
MLYPHLIHTFDNQNNLTGVWVVISRSNLTPEDWSWTNLTPFKGDVYVPSPDLLNEESCFKFNTLHDAHKFLARFWAAYVRVEEEARFGFDPIKKNTVSFLTLEG